MPSILPPGFSFLFCSSRHPVFQSYFLCPVCDELDSLEARGQQVTMPEEQQVVEPGFTWGNSPETGGAMPDAWGGTSWDLPPNVWGTKL